MNDYNHKRAAIASFYDEAYREVYQIERATDEIVKAFEREHPYLGYTADKDYIKGLPQQSDLIQHTKQKKALSGSQIPASTLSINAMTGAQALVASGVHKLWGMVQIQAFDRNEQFSETPIDFVVVIDHSSSMKLHSKMAFVQATIEYFISKLQEAHRFCLIKFNQEVSFVTSGLLSMTKENKKKVLSLLRDIKPQGTTNISDALFTAVGLLNSRPSSEQARISSIMLFTDGLANAGLRGRTFMDALKSMNVPQGLTINTFGYGVDHDSRMLQNVSFCSKGGVYYYIENTVSIAATFGECLAGILSTVSHNIDIRLVAQDGCRLVNFYTKFPITEIKSVKEYSIALGSMYSQEQRSLLFKMSLRKMDFPIPEQMLVNIIVTYTNTLTGKEITVETPMKISRPAVVPFEPKIPIELDKQINRYTAASAIEDAVRKASTNDFNAAQQQLQDVIETVRTSASAQDPSCKYYCEDLVEDLKECAIGLADPSLFSSGIHYAHAYSTMYYLERSTGSKNLMGVKKYMDMQQQLLQEQQQLQQRIFCQGNGSPPSPLSSSPDDVDTSVFLQELQQQKHKRHYGYGYMTYAQEEEATQAQKQTAIFVTGYLENALA